MTPTAEGGGFRKRFLNFTMARTFKFIAESYSDFATAAECKASAATEGDIEVSNLSYLAGHSEVSGIRNDWTLELYDPITSDSTSGEIGEIADGRLIYNLITYKPM